MKDYDYSSEGAYFLTICTEQKACLFGDIANDQVRLNDQGTMVKGVWEELASAFQGIELDQCVIMPNHIHGIISIVGANLCVRPQAERYSTGKDSGPTHRSAPTVGRLVQWFKTMTTNYYIRGVKEHDWPTFSRRLWQRNYYERVIRDENELNQIRQYILDNPLKWELDPENIHAGTVNKP